MSCRHRHGHTCGWPPPYAPDEPYGWEPKLGDADRTDRKATTRRSGRRRTLTRASLVSEAEDLRDELRRLEQDIDRLEAEPRESTRQ
jgi:hypothetical protein